MIDKKIRKRYKDIINQNKDNHIRFYEKYRNSFQRFDEETFSDLCQYADKGCAIFSIFKLDNTDEENLLNHKKLKEYLMKYKLRFFEIDTVYVNKNNIKKSELSFFVPSSVEEYSFDEFKHILIDINNQLELHGIVFKYPKDKEQGKVVYVYKTEEEVINNTIITFNELIQAYSRFRLGNHGGDKLSFKGYRVPANHIEAYLLIKEGYLF
ncbi:MAG TPA: hypothetical protein PLO73_05090 [Spirochaetota bacterium]|nr:hypothetical protein [Spirochaetota bacterium]